MTAGPDPSKWAIRVIEVLADTAGGNGLQPVMQRRVEMSLTTLREVTMLLGADGVCAFTYAMERLEVIDTGSGRALATPKWSAAWIAEISGLGRNASNKAVSRMETHGLFIRIAGMRGVGARGGHRAVLNEDLVDLGARRNNVHARLPAIRMIRSQQPAIGFPVPQEGGNREAGDANPQVGLVPQKVGNREAGPGLPLSQESGKRERGLGSPDSQEVGIREDDPGSPAHGEPGSSANPEVTPVRRIPGNRVSTGSTSSKEPGKYSSLLGARGMPGRLRRILAPAVAEDRDRVALRLYRALCPVVDDRRLHDLQAPLGFDRFGGRLQELCELLADLMDSSPPSPAAILGSLKVRSIPQQWEEHELADRLFVGLVVGLGANVKAWGGWMTAVLTPAFTPKSNAPLGALNEVLDHFAAVAAPPPRGPEPAVPSVDTYMTDAMVEELREVALAAYPHPGDDEDPDHVRRAVHHMLNSNAPEPR